MMPSHWEVMVIFVIVLLLFGAKRIPEMARGLGKGIREFRTAVKDVQDEVTVAGRADAAPPISPTPAPGQVAREATSSAAVPPSPADEAQGASATPEEARS